jgi:hypothetical protein
VLQLQVVVGLVAPDGRFCDHPGHGPDLVPVPSERAPRPTLRIMCPGGDRPLLCGVAALAAHIGPGSRYLTRGDPSGGPVRSRAGDDGRSAGLCGPRLGAGPDPLVELEATGHGLGAARDRPSFDCSGPNAYAEQSID